MERDPPPVVTPTAFIADAVFIQQSAGVDIQLHRQGVRLHIHDEQGHQLRRCTLPVWSIVCKLFCYQLKKRFGRELPKLRFRPFQLPYQLFGIAVEIEPLILLISAGHIKRCGVCRALFRLEQESTVSRTEQTVGAGDHIIGIV